MSIVVDPVAVLGLIEFRVESEKSNIIFLMARLDEVQSLFRPLDRGIYARQDQCSRRNYQALL